jgi:ParB/RepB/Spo0J family partition protein
MNKLVDVHDIIVEDRIRQDFGDLQALINSIKETGVIHPVAVTEEEDGKYRLLAGERRMRACIELNYKQIPVTILKKNMSKKEMKLIELAENLYRKDFTWQEEIALKRQIFETKKDIANEQRKFISQNQIASEIGESPQNFGRDLKLAEVMESMPDIGKAKNKHEAMKLMDTLMEKIVLEEMENRRRKRQSVEESNPLENCFIVGDSFELLKKEEDASWDFIEMDPPYGIGYDEMKKNDENLSTYHEVEKDEYPLFLSNLLSETYRILKPNRFSILWFGMQWYQVIRDIAEDVGWTIDAIPNIWVKVDAQAQNMRPKKNFSNTYEPFFILRKGNPSLVTNAPQNVINEKQVFSLDKVHATEKPIELMEGILKNFLLPNYKVLSPFLGSGNIILAAYNVGNFCKGFDLEDLHKKRYLARVISKNYKTYKEDKK